MASEAVVETEPNTSDEDDSQHIDEDIDDIFESAWCAGFIKENDGQVKDREAIIDGEHGGLDVTKRLEDGDCVEDTYTIVDTYSFV